MSASASALGDGDDGVQRRFLEASRRAEIVTLVNSAHTEAELADVVIEELGEALESEVAFILAAEPGRTDWVVLARTGLSDEQVATVSANRQGSAAFDDLRAQVHSGTDLLEMGARHLILSPWKARNGRQVLIGVARLDDEGFTPSEVALLEAITVSVGHALERAWLGAERDRHAARQTSLVRAAKALNASLVIDEVIRTLCREISEALAADVVAVYFADECGELRAVAGSGIPEEALGREQPAGAPPAAVIRTGTPAVLRSQPEDPAIDLGLRGVDGVRCGFVVPARRHDDFDGALLVGFLSDRTIGEADIELLGGFAELAGIAYRNADEHHAVQRAAMLDSLTGCLNHGAFHGRLREEIARADRSRRCLTLISIDLDDFKSVNDRFGHPTGDALLRTLADVLRDAVRSYDQVGRLGGDEFVVLLPASGTESARRVLDRVTAAMSRAKLPGGAEVTVSAGVARWRRGEEANQLVERADRSLLEAKAARGGDDKRSAPAGRSPDVGLHVDGGEQEHLRRLVTAGALGTRLARMLDQPAIVETAVGDLREALGYEECLIVRGHADGTLEVLATTRSEPHPAEARASLTAWPDDLGAPDTVRRAIAGAAPVFVDAPDAGRSGALARGAGAIRAELAVPVFVASEAWGAIAVRSSEAGAFAAADAQLLQRVADHVGSALRTAVLHRDLEEAYLSSAAALAAALEAKDLYTADHARAIADWAVRLGRALELDEEELGDLHYGALLHDIGKIAIPDAILNKRGALDEAETSLIREHPLVGERILAPISFRSEIPRIVRHDHERWDGTGYPDGLSGKDIPLGARIVFVVDAFHAMTSDRPYRKAMSRLRARRELERHAGTQFDPGIVGILLESLEADEP